MTEGRVRGEPRESTDDDPLTRLLELRELRDHRRLTDDEYDEASAALLAQI